MMAGEGPAITFGARGLSRALAQLCRFRKMRALWIFCAAWMRARSIGVTTPFALALFSRFCTRAWPFSSFWVSLKFKSPCWTPLKMRCCWAFWRASIKGVPAKPVADVTARTSEARIIILITILLCVAVAGCDDIMSALDLRHAQDG